MDHLLKAKKEYKKIKETGRLRYIYQNKLDKACSQLGMAYGDFKDFPINFLIKYYVIKHLILLKSKI